MGRLRRWLGRAAVAVVLVGALPGPGTGEVVRVVVDRREVLLDGRAFGEAGAYELLEGRIFFAFDPDAAANAAVVDLALAPRGDDGRVEVWTGFVVLQPVDPQNRRGIAWMDLGPGGVGATGPLLHRATRADADPGTEAALGDALLLRQGLTLIRIGWDPATPDRPGRLGLQVPAAVEADGDPVTGWVRLDWVVETSMERLPLAPPGARAYPVAIPEAPVHILTVRDDREAPRDTVDADRWDFVFAVDGPDAGRPTAVEVDGGAEAGRIYELVYRAQDPRVVGLSLAVVRDVMAYSRYDLRSEFPTNRGIAFGVASGGRFLRQFLHEGFNTDEGGRPVFDAVWIHGAGAGRGSFNGRFAQPDRSPAGFRDFLHPVDLFPFTFTAQFDPVTGLEQGLLDGLPEGARPRTVTTHLGYDYWGRGAALTHTSIDGFRDVAVDERDRVYHLASTSPDTDPDDPVAGPDVRPTLRAIALATVAWVADGVAPPPSRLPAIGHGTLVPASALALPTAPAIPDPPVPHLVHRPDYGHRFLASGIIDREPPDPGLAFPAQVPQLDGLGNEAAGVRSLDVRVPLATYLPWDVRGEGVFAGTARPGRGRAIVFALTDAEAEARGDGRPSLQRLYGSEAGFLARVRAAAAALVDEGFLLDEDREGAIAAARVRWLRATSR